MGIYDQKVDEGMALDLGEVTRQGLCDLKPNNIRDTFDTPLGKARISHYWEIDCVNVRLVRVVDAESRLHTSIYLHIQDGKASLQKNYVGNTECSVRVFQWGLGTDHEISIPSKEEAEKITSVIIPAVEDYLDKNPGFMCRVNMEAISNIIQCSYRELEMARTSVRYYENRISELQEKFAELEREATREVSV